MDLNIKRALVIGSGVSGKGAAEALKTLGAEVVMTETMCEAENIRSYDLIVVSPGVPPSHPIFGQAEREKVPLTGDIGLGAALNAAPVIAVTGTNGKTTTVGMIGEIYAAAGIKATVCGNIGKSFAACAIAGGYERAVLEVSSFQLLHAAPLKPRIACLLNITPDHLDYHGDMRSYIAAKMHIADFQTESDYLIVPPSVSISGIKGTPVVLTEGRDFFADEWLNVFGKRVMPVSEILAKGAHNVKNALYAAAATYADGVSESAIEYALSRFRTGAHRICAVGEFNGTCFYNDSKGTNVAATLAAAECMTGNTALIAGGSDKSCDYGELFDKLPENVTAVYLTGANAEKMAAAATAAGGRFVKVCATLRECVSLCGRGGYDSVLFSPASASFDRYSGYAERGRAFEREIERLISGTD
ncbi:MAG TPA: UDP-N-acetylmuramoyl-L-alanine--D-glutamate ligase [Firmicutes bacterium]|nr:UDP-N-acetylmuramoyl-L-alanine--D-glutamate ligase [Bacillota bacterium]